MKYLLTGGSGFIGSHLVDRLLKKGNEIVIIDRNIKYHNLPKVIPKQLKIYHENIMGNIVDLFKDVDYVIHLAALTRPQWSIKYPFETTIDNVNGTIKLLEHSKNNNIKRFVFVSSSDLYGDQPFYPTDEDMTPNPMNTYALSKWVGEQYCELFYKLYGLEYNIIRPFNCYGDRMPLSGVYTSAVATFINALKNNKTFVTFGTGRQRRDFVYIDDIVDMIILLTKSKVKNQAFNCGSGENYSINEIRRIIEKIIGNKIPFKRLPAQYEKKLTLASMHKAYALLDWRPKVDIKEGLKLTIEKML